MTFDEAIEFKKTIGETYSDNDWEYKVMVVPKKPADLQKYYSHYLYNKCTDETAKEISSDFNFEVYALNIVHGNNLLPKKLS